MKPRTKKTATAMRRIDYVRLFVEDCGTRAEVVGVGFRLPVSRPVPLSYASKLISEGMPSVAHHRQSLLPGPVAEGG
jgi:hypothetical protein